jgi:hypothetical protein
MIKPLLNQALDIYRDTKDNAISSASNIAKSASSAKNNVSDFIEKQNNKMLNTLAETLNTLHASNHNSESGLIKSLNRVRSTLASLTKLDRQDSERNTNPIANYYKYESRAQVLKKMSACLEAKFEDRSPVVNKIKDCLNHHQSEYTRLAQSAAASISSHDEQTLSQREMLNIARQSAIVNFIDYQDTLSRARQQAIDPDPRMETPELWLPVDSGTLGNSLIQGIKLQNELDPNFRLNSVNRTKAALGKMIADDQQSYKPLELELIKVRSDNAKSSISYENIASDDYRVVDEIINNEIKPNLNVEIKHYGALVDLYKNKQVITLKPDPDSLSRHQEFVDMQLADELTEKEKVVLPMQDDFTQQISLLKKKGETGLYLLTALAKNSPANNNKSLKYVIPFEIK